MSMGRSSLALLKKLALHSLRCLSASIMLVYYYIWTINARIISVNIKLHTREPTRKIKVNDAWDSPW